MRQGHALWPENELNNWIDTLWKEWTISKQAVRASSFCDSINFAVKLSLARYEIRI